MVQMFHIQITHIALQNQLLLCSYGTDVNYKHTTTTQYSVQLQNYHSLCH